MTDGVSTNVCTGTVAARRCLSQVYRGKRERLTRAVMLLLLEYVPGEDWSNVLQSGLLTQRL